MSVLCIAVIVLSVVLGVSSDINISDDDYALLPPIFYIDPYEKCIKGKQLFCRVSLELLPQNAKRSSKIWKLIEETTKSGRHYNHDQLYHAICVNETSYDLVTLKNIVSKDYNHKYKHKGLEVKVVEVNCNHIQYHFTLYDIVILSVIILYLCLIFGATIRHIKMKKDVEGSYIVLFSIVYNVGKLCKIYQQENFQKLKCIQAIRFYTTVFIIFCHTFCSFAGGYIANTKYLEDIPLNFIRHGIRTFFVFLVQSFFFISAWLLSYHTFTIFEKNKNINVFKYVIVTFINRYLRIIPPLVLMVSLASSIWIYGSFHGPVKEVFSDEEFKRCQKNWWIIFFFFSNHYQQYNMCYFTTWYLSADTQLYALSLILLMVMVKLKQIKMFMAICLIFGITIQSIVTYLYDLDIIYRITPENSKNSKFLTFEFSATYASTYSNMASYMLGLIFGYAYFRLNNKFIFNSKVSIILWWILSIVLPLAVIAISSYEYSRIVSALLAGILRPLYAFGIGIAIFGMSQKIGGFLRRLCEWKPVLFLGNFTYATYVGHFGIVFYRTAIATEPISLSDYVLLTSFLQDTVLSFICGFIIHLLVEMPASHLQRLFVYKFSIHNFKSKTKNKE